MKMFTFKRYLFAAPDTAKDGDGLFEASNARRGRRNFKAPRVRFFKVVTGANAEFEATAAQDRQGRGLFGQHAGEVVHGGDDHWHEVDTRGRHGKGAIG